MGSDANDMLRAFDAKFRTAEMEIAPVDCWVLSVRPAQSTLGAMVLSARSGATDLAALTREEAIGMGTGFGLAETLARKTFGAARINILCLMMQDPIVHFHILPRYDRVVTFAGLDWEDADWPGPPQLRAIKPEDHILIAIRDALVVRRP